MECVRSAKPGTCLTAVDDTDDVSETISESNLQRFIRCYETCEALWDPCDKNYLNKSKKDEYLNKLLKIYKSMKSNATTQDVRNKLNCLRSNYRKELKKIDDANRLGEVYIPTSTTFHALGFLSTVNRGDENPEPVAKHNEPTTSSQSPQKPVDLIVLVWSEKLKELSPTQRLYAEKAINNVLFEAQLNDLNRNSGQVNSFSPSSAPFTSYLCTPPPIIHIPENFNNNSNSNPTGIKIKKGLPSPIIIKRPRNNVATINALKFISKQCSVKNLFEQFKP
ncbi:uncharacterized protein LOC143920580 [Arctopsyche grandis]|uniref:uncharacterized protein LOC143920580 n=1 Tax=Arctopsyche grandis TaxID=121162 RepID=UPI00406D95DA